VKGKPKQRLPEPAPAAKPQSHAAGLWRDGSLLVIDLDSHHFPRRCLISNWPVNAASSITLACHNPPWLEIDRLERNRRQSDANIRIVRGHKSGITVYMDLQLPLTPRWRYLKTSFLGRWLLFGALGVLAFIVASQLLVQQLEMNGEYLAIWSWCGLVALVLTGVLIIMLQSLLLPVYRLEERKIWVSGVQRKFLDDLPEFVPSRGMLERAIQSLVSRKWVSLGLCIVLWGLAAFAWFSMTPPEATTTAVIFVMAAVSLAAAALGIYSHYAAAKQQQRMRTLYPPRPRRRPRQNS
jgi:branched-subunit amino acid transport protein